MISKALRKWVAKTGPQIQYIAPGSPWENGYCEQLQWQAEGRVPTPRDLLLSQGGTDRDWDLAEYLQPRSTAFVLGLPAARACHLPGSGLPVAHGRHGLPPCSGPSSKLVRGRPGADPVCGPRPMQVLGRLELTPFVVHGLCKVSGCWS